MHVILVPVGSSGDVHPLVGLGASLRARGHDVSLIANTRFASLATSRGLGFVEWGTAEQYDEATRHPDLWHSRRGIEVVASKLLEGMPELYDTIARLCGRGRESETVLVGHTMAFAARVAHDTLGVPLVTVHLQPSSLYSLHDTPVFHRWLWSINELAPEVKRALFSLISYQTDRVFGPAANAVLTRVGRDPARDILSVWCNSPQRVIGLFPEWYANPQPDWPAPTALTGFPLFDEDNGASLDPGLEPFLRAEPDVRPIVLVAGSANRQAHRFFQTGVEACRALGRRGILLTAYPEQIPTGLPNTVAWFDYVPLGRLLPDASALVHHGGIGTAAQGLAHGVPQIVMPMTFDQPDNAHRLESLGVARTVWPRSFRGPQLAAALDGLIAVPSVTERCAELAARIRTAEPLTRTCELIEQAAA